MLFCIFQATERVIFSYVLLESSFTLIRLTNELVCVKEIKRVRVFGLEHIVEADSGM